MTISAMEPFLWYLEARQVSLSLYDPQGENGRFSLIGSNYFDPDKPILPAYDGTQTDLILHLPTGVTV